MNRKWKEKNYINFDINVHKSYLKRQRCQVIGFYQMMNRWKYSSLIFGWNKYSSNYICFMV